MVPNWERSGQGCILPPCLFTLHAEYIIRNAGLYEEQVGIKIAGENINNETHCSTAIPWNVTHNKEEQTTDERFQQLRRGWTFPGGSAVKNLLPNTGDAGLIPELGRSPEY